MNSTVPTPNIFANRKAPTVPAPPARVAAHIDVNEPGTIVRPGMVEVLDESVTHDGVVKAKHLERGQRVRPYVRGQARGAERIVGSIKRTQGGSHVLITWASPHSPEERAASYRFFDETLLGTPLVVRKPGFVAYQEV